MLKNKKAKKGLGTFIVIVIIVIVIIIFLNLHYGKQQSIEKQPTIKQLDIILSLENYMVKPNEPTTLSVQVTNLNDTVIDGNLSVRAIQGSEFVSITTLEDTHIYLPNKDSSVGKIYTVIGDSSVTVEPHLIAEVELDNGKIFRSSSITLRIDVNKP